MTLTLHHIKNTRSLRPLWLMEELALEYTLIDEGPNTSALKRPEFKLINPLGKIPCLFDGDIRITESVAMLQYIADRHGGKALTRSIDHDEYARYLQLLFFGEAGMGGYTNMLIAHTALLPEEHRNPQIAKWAAREMATCLDYLDGELRDREYFLGEFSIVDISITYILFLLKITKNAGGFSENLVAYFKRATTREAWQKASSA